MNGTAGPAGEGGAPRFPRRGTTKLRVRLSNALDRLFDSRALWCAVFLLGLAPLMIGREFGHDVPVPPAGSIVDENIVAPVSREFADDRATRSARDAARASVPPVYDLDRGALDGSIASVRRAFDEWRRAAGETGAGDAGALDGAEAYLPMTPAAMRYLGQARFDAAIEERLAAALRSASRWRITGSRALLPREGTLTLRDPRGEREWTEEAPARAMALDDARRLAADVLQEAGAPPAEVAVLAPLVRDLIVPNLTYNGGLTEARRQDASSRIEPLRIRIPRGKVLLRRGEIAGEESVRLLTAYNDARIPWTTGRVILGNLLFMALMLFFIARYAFFYQRANRTERHLFPLMVVVLVLGLALDRGSLWLLDGVIDGLRAPPGGDPQVLRTLVPVATGAMLVTLLSNARVGMAFALFYVPLFGMMVEWDLRFTLFCLISNLAAIFGITTYRQRTAPIKAGLVLGGINALAVVALQGIPGRAPVALAAPMICGFASGIVVAILVSFLLPVMEAAFNIVTDVRLLELSNLNNPLLRRLAVEAPGSYNHSVIVGTLAEAAAESIGANALFCRVAAYYHDVGKLLKPDYFIENQKRGINRHDRLSPHLSALVIASHVKEGYELARSYGLPRQILDIIPQHHGTRKINFFYQKARRAQDGGGETEVRESDYRYPGPKPQTKEAVIFMLADSIEAAARTLEDPSPPRFKGMIRRIVSDIVLDGQLDQSDMTFSDLEKVCASFLQTLSSIYHHRIDYPGFDFEKTPERPFHASRTHEEPPHQTTRWGR